MRYEDYTTLRLLFNDFKNLKQHLKRKDLLKILFIMRASDSQHSFQASGSFLEFLSLTSFFVMSYTSSRWPDGRIDTKRLTRQPQPKSNFFLGT